MICAPLVMNAAKIQNSSVMEVVSKSTLRLSQVGFLVSLHAPKSYKDILKLFLKYFFVKLPYHFIDQTRSYITNANSYCTNPTTMRKTYDNAILHCENTPGCHMFYKDNVGDYYICPWNAIVDKKARFTLFIAGKCYLLLTFTIYSLFKNVKDYLF